MASNDVAKTIELALRPLIFRVWASCDGLPACRWSFCIGQVCHPERRLPDSKDLAAAVFAAVICPGPRCVVDQTNHSARSALSEILQLRFRMTGESLTALTLTGFPACLKPAWKAGSEL